LDNIIARIREGDGQAFEEIYTELREPFIAWSLKNYEGTRDHAVEFYQMAILIFYDNIQQGKLTELHSSVKSYLFAIGKNKWREYYREKQRAAPGSAIDLTHLIVEASSEEYDIDLQLIKEGLAGLGEPCRQLLEAFYYQGMNLDEIVLRFGYKNKDAAKTAKYKCLQRLKRSIRWE
jgi:RNA polymerase sigma-70 factor (ECF subfamily)